MSLFCFQLPVLSPRIKHGLRRSEEEEENNSKSFVHTAKRVCGMSKLQLCLLHVSASFSFRLFKMKIDGDHGNSTNLGHMKRHSGSGRVI